MQVNLRVLAGPYKGQVFPFDQHDTFLIGRTNDAHLCLPDDRFFSRHHCLLEIDPPQCFLRDLGSTNGTFVNGQRVSQSFLKHGDQIQGGESVLLVEVSALAAGARETNSNLPITQPAIVSVECLNCGRRELVQAATADEHLTFLCEDCRQELRSAPQPVPGYDMVRVLGRGGMGCVTLGRDQKTGQAVAIKTLLPECAVSDKAMRRFMREIDVAAALKHPNIVEFLDRGTNNGVCTWSLSLLMGPMQLSLPTRKAASFRAATRSLSSRRSWLPCLTRTRRATFIGTSRTRTSWSGALEKTPSQSSRTLAWQRALPSQA